MGENENMSEELRAMQLELQRRFDAGQMTEAQRSAWCHLQCSLEVAIEYPDVPIVRKLLAWDVARYAAAQTERLQGI